MDHSIAVTLSDSKLTPEQILQFHHAWGKTKLTGQETIYRATARAVVDHAPKTPEQTQRLLASVDRDETQLRFERVFTCYSTTAQHARAQCLDAAFAWAKELTS